MDGSVMLDWMATAAEGDGSRKKCAVTLELLAHLFHVHALRYWIGLA